ncbi:enoyl-CoA hydratase/isomerase family protein [Natrialbaceae archaeon AArc-T1-2]|uniref:enoyl-CoA hydratase/isomerase family protein n=1 Tax=Natrialbaceae archaeon AArc-T1-2 TaxID=3053904 RepID=UPI00255AF0A5|nr:enoyl-CoA hydratase/isomerase family protein [Natrialbaceae archaeon AArc-T1-2]WIV68872.1 enoyl-CoA hydratase/isomerase family protein [Natrialbaceae archaeon AArc-T1-2]
MYDDINYETREGIATITIDRPEKYNAFTANTVAELNEAIRTADEDDGVYAIVLTGAGDGFCTGADVDSMPDWDEMSKEEYAGFLWGVQNVVRQLRTIPTPSVAAVNGPAVGAGCDFALACDMRYVAPSAFFREGFVRVGLIPGDGGGWLLPRLVGESKAREYLLTGKDIDAEAAEEMGLVVDVAEDTVAAATAMAEDIRDLPRLAVQQTKQLIDPQRSFEDYSERAIEYQWNCVNDPEHHAAVDAFGTAEKPDYDREYS